MRLRVCPPASLETTGRGAGCQFARTSAAILRTSAPRAKEKGPARGEGQGLGSSAGAEIEREGGREEEVGRWLDTDYPPGRASPQTRARKFSHALDAGLGRPSGCTKKEAPPMKSGALMTEPKAQIQSGGRWTREEDTPSAEGGCRGRRIRQLPVSRDREPREEDSVSGHQRQAEYGCGHVPQQCVKQHDSHASGARGSAVLTKSGATQAGYRK